MLTLMVLVLLGYSFIYNWRHRMNMVRTDHVLFFAVALISLGLAVARDLDVHVPMLTGLLRSGMENLGEVLMQKG